jgi:hypothetical protein
LTYSYWLRGYWFSNYWLHYGAVTPPTPSPATGGGGGSHFITQRPRFEQDLTPTEKPVEQVIPQPLLIGMTFEEMVQYVHDSLHIKDDSDEMENLTKLLSTYNFASATDIEQELKNQLLKLASKLEIHSSEDTLIEALKKFKETQKN